MFKQFFNELFGKGNELKNPELNPYDYPDVIWFSDENSKPEKKEEGIGEIIKKPKLEDMVYPENIGEIIKLLIKKTKKKNINLLFYGGQGTGKSSTGKMLAVETNRPFVYLNGAMNKNKIIEILTNLKPNSLVLIDEIHSWNTKNSEIIYPAIQDNELVIDGKSYELDCMFIATTTEPQEIPKPLRDRFQEIELEELDTELLKEVLKKKGCPDEVCDYLLNFTTNMRVLENVLEMMDLYGDYNMKNLRKVFKLKRIDINKGLSEIQEKYLEYLKRQKKAGARIIGLHLKKSENYLKYEVEPDLIRKGLIVTTSRGREINPELADGTIEYMVGDKDVKEKRYEEDERETAIRFLNENPHIKKKFGSKYFELVNFLAEKIAEGIEPDEIDVESFGEDKDFNDSYDDNYKPSMEELGML